MQFYIPSLGYIEGQSFTLAGVRYPDNWLELASPAERAAINAFARPAYNPTQQALELDPLTGWSVRPLTAEELQAVADAEAAAAAAVIANARALAVQAVQARLDTHAQSWGYDNIFTACTYADEPTIPQFQAEGQALRAWRSQTWALCYANVDAPSLDALLALLPALPARPS